MHVLHLNKKEKRHGIYLWAKKNDYHICFLQETYCTQANSIKCKRGWSGDIIHSHTNSTYSRGVAILLNKKLDYSKYSLVRNHVCVAQSFLITGFPYVGIRCSRENEYCINKQ